MVATAYIYQICNQNISRLDQNMNKKSKPVVLLLLRWSYMWIHDDQADLKVSSKGQKVFATWFWYFGR